MLTINTNLSSLIAQQSLKQSTNKLNTAIERMTTGFKINSAKDNAANYSISTNMTTKIGAYQVAEDNAAMGLDLIGTAEGTLSQIQDKLARLRALAEQAANGTYGEQSLNAINTEANAIVDEIERVYNNTEYNGINLMKGRVTGTEESKFIKDIDRRDTSKMKTLASVDETKELTYGTYSISTAEELAKLATMTNNGLVGADTEFVLANDIDLQAWCDAHSATGGWVPIGTSIFADTSWDEVDGNPFRGKFDGNGYSISNLTIARVASYQGLFGYVEDGGIQNLKLENVNITNSSGSGYRCIGSLIGSLSGDSNISNCFVDGGTIDVNAHNVGGLIGYIRGYRNESSYHDTCSSTLSDCSVSINLNGTFNIAGIAGASYDLTLSNCYTEGNFSGSFNTAGIIGQVGGANMQSVTTITKVYTTAEITRTVAAETSSGIVANFTARSLLKIQNAYVYTEKADFKGIFVGKQDNNGNIIIENCAYSDFYNDKSIPNVYSTDGSTHSVNNVTSFTSGTQPFLINSKSNIFFKDSEINLQVGINSNSVSQISVDTGFALDGLSMLRNIGTGTGDYLGQIDFMLDRLSESTTNLGATSNRLESVLDEIQIQHDNLVSSRSTLRDADIAEVSAEYIQQQILQQASATLLATANQSPSIALQLI